MTVSVVTKTVAPTTVRSARLAQLTLAVVAVFWAGLYILVPALAHELGTELGVEHLIVPYAVAGCLTVAAGHIIVLGVWMLVGFIKSGRFYAQPVLRWIGRIKAAVFLGCAMPEVVGLHLLFVENAGGPLMPVAVLMVPALAVAAWVLLDLLAVAYREAQHNTVELAQII